MNKYFAKRKYSTLCGRWFASKKEAARGEELTLMEKGGLIQNLQFQHRFILNKKPKVTIDIDFIYQVDGEQIYEDTKGYKETREFRVKRIWLHEQKGIDVILS